MKNFFYPIAFIICFNLSVAQQKFYETSWTSNNVTYTGLLMYKSDTDAKMRVKYIINGLPKVAEFQCYKIPFNNDGIKGYYWDGRNAKIVIGSGSSYNADNFYFFKKGGYYSAPMHIDDYGMNQNNKGDYYTRVSYWKEIIPNNFTESYVSSYFKSYEVEYDKLLMLKLTNSTGPIQSSTTSLNTSNKSSVNKTNISTIPEDTDLGYITNYNIGSYKEKWLIRSSFPKLDINDLWDEGYDINSLAFAKNKWIVDFTKKTQHNFQRWFTRKEFPKDKIKEGWDDGLLVSSLTYGNGAWATIMSKGTGYYSQSWKTRINYPNEEINKGWDDGKAITQISYEKDVWVLVMSKGTGYYSQSTFRDATMPQEKIKQGWDNGKYITSFSYGNGQWVIVMSKGSKYTNQRWRTRIDFPKEEIEKGWKEGYEITALDYNKDDKIWGLVMSKIKK